jgi:hypothetical protein
MSGYRERRFRRVLGCERERKKDLHGDEVFKGKYGFAVTIPFQSGMLS